MRKTLLLLLPLVPLGLWWMVSATEVRPPGSADNAEQNEAWSDPAFTGSALDLDPGGTRTERTELAPAPAKPPTQATLSGVVVDEAGIPVAHVPLVATASFDTLSPMTQSHEDGTFLIRRRFPETRRVRIAVVPQSRSGFRILSEDRLLDWGTEGIRIVVSRPRTTVLSVVEEGTGAPVESFDWRLEPLSPSSYEKRQGWGDHEGGRTEMTSLEYGKHRLLVFPYDEDLVPTPPIELDVFAVGREVRVELHRRRPLSVRVLGEDGTPVRGTEVELLRNEGRGELRLDSPTGPADVNFTGLSTASILDSGRTDAWGEVVLRGPGRVALAVKALGPGHAPELVTDVTLRDTDNQLVIEVQAGAVVTGTLHPLSLLGSLRDKLSPRERAQDRYRPGVFLSREPGGSRFPLEADKSAAIQADGSFRIEHVPSGNWDVHLSFMGGSGTSIRYSAQQKLATVRNLESGETRHITLDASALVPGRITGQIFLDGKPLAHGLFGLDHRALDATVGSLSTTRLDGLVTDADGRFSAEIEAGWVGVFVSLRKAGPGMPMHSAEKVPVLPSQTSTGAFHLVRRTMRVRFLERDGSPATERYFSFGSGRTSYGLSEFRTDADGWLVLDPAPSDPVTFYTWPKRIDILGAARSSTGRIVLTRIILGPVRIPPGTRKAAFTLRLPDDGK